MWRLKVKISEKLLKHVGKNLIQVFFFPVLLFYMRRFSRRIIMDFKDLF